MFSGKSTELARRIRRHKVANRQCLVVKYAGDTRYEDESGTSAKGHVITHDRQSLAAVPCSRLADVANIVHAFDVVGVDEGQFFGDLAECCEAWARAGKTVIVAALDATFQQKPFNDVLSLVPIADEVTKLSAVCARCGDDAAFTKRVNTESKRLELIGGAECYAASCRRCFDCVFPTTSLSSPAPAVATTTVRATTVRAKKGEGNERARRKRRSSAYGLSPVSVPGSVPAGGADEGEKKGVETSEHAANTPSMVSMVGEKMRSLTVASPATPAMGLSAFGSPVSTGRERASRDLLGETYALGAGKKKKAAGLGAAAAAAAAEVMGAGRPAGRGAGGPGRSPIMDLAGRGMGAVARSPLANVR